MLELTRDLYPPCRWGSDFLYAGCGLIMLNLEVVLDSTFSGGRDFLEIPNMNPSLAMPILSWRMPWLVMTGFT